MSQPKILPSFAAGELAPSLYGRTDLAKYHVGAALLQNYFVDYRGGASSRSGTSFIGQCKDSTTPNRLIPFSFSTIQNYALVFGNNTMRVVKDGGLVLEASDAITGIPNAGTCVIATTNAYSVGDLVYLNNIGGMTQLNERYATVSAATGSQVTLLDMYGANINTTAYGAYTSGGTISRVYTLTTPYAASDLALLKFAQSANVMTLTHNSYTPQVLTRSGDASWTITSVSFVPASTAPAGVTVANTAGSGTTYPNTFYDYVATAVVNGVESLPSNVAATGGIYALGQNTGAHNTVTIPSVTGAELYNIYRTQENLSATVPLGALYGYVGAVTPAATNTFIDNNILPDFTNCPPQAYNPFTVAGNPGCVTYYQERQAFGGMANAPEQIDFSKSGDFFNMNYSIPSKPDDNIEITISSLQVNAIKYMIPMQSLIVLTSSGAWKVDGGTASAITPTQVSATSQAYNGCSDIQPITINYDILYVQAKGAGVRDLSYNFYVNLYTGTDITMLSNHLFYGHQILNWCYAEEPWKIVWCVREDGVLLSLTYLKEQDVQAWAHHNTQGKFLSVCSVSEGSEDAVYAIVGRMINGQYLQYIERFESRFMGGDPTLQIPGSATVGLPADVTRAWCVDAGLQYPLTYPAATLTPVGAQSNNVIWGVDNIFGGSNYGPLTSVSVTDPTGSGALFTTTTVGGVLSVAVFAPGQNYTNPVFVIYDPSGAGSGAVFQAILASPQIMSPSASVFTSLTVGDVVRINNGMGVVLAEGGGAITVNMINPMTNSYPALPGAWSCTAPVTVVAGLDHLDGEMVSILADGNVEASRMVVAGSITLDQPATAITIGLGFTCQLQTLYIDIEGGPTVQSKRKTIPAVTVRMQDSRGLSVGPDFNTLTEIKERTTQPMGQPIPLFTGDQRVVTESVWTVGGQVCVQNNYPLPSTILALIPEIYVGDT